jgi:SAM-dependent methyltransferase
MTTQLFSATPSYYEKRGALSAVRSERGRNFARQALETVEPFIKGDFNGLSVLDLGSGYGYTAVGLASFCGHVVADEPSQALHDHATGVIAESKLTNVEPRNQSIDDLQDSNAYDLIILDNVLEHLPDHERAMFNITRALKVNGVLYIVVPNKLWPIEVHYHLPFLSYLPLSLANVYLRLTGKGDDYTDASYAPTYWSLKRLFNKFPALEYEFVLPANLSLTTQGNTFLYRWGTAAIRRFPELWSVSKALLVVARKRSAN